MLSATRPAGPNERGACAPGVLSSEHVTNEASAAPQILGTRPGLPLVHELPITSGLWVDSRLPSCLQLSECPTSRESTARHDATIPVLASAPRRSRLATDHS